MHLDSDIVPGQPGIFLPDTHGGENLNTYRNQLLALQYLLLTAHARVDLRLLEKYIRHDLYKLLGALPPLLEWARTLCFWSNIITTFYASTELTRDLVVYLVTNKDRTFAQEMHRALARERSAQIAQDPKAYDEEAVQEYIQQSDAEKQGTLHRVGNEESDEEYLEGLEQDLQREDEPQAAMNPINEMTRCQWMQQILLENVVLLTQNKNDSHTYAARLLAQFKGAGYLSGPHTALERLASVDRTDSRKTCSVVNKQMHLALDPAGPDMLDSGVRCQVFCAFEFKTRKQHQNQPEQQPQEGTSSSSSSVTSDEDDEDDTRIPQLVGTLILKHSKPPEDPPPLQLTTTISEEQMFKLLEENGFEEEYKTLLDPDQRGTYRDKLGVERERRRMVEQMNQQLEMIVDDEDKNSDEDDDPFSSRQNGLYGPGLLHPPPHPPPGVYNPFVPQEMMFMAQQQQQNIVGASASSSSSSSRRVVAAPQNMYNKVSQVGVSLSSTRGANKNANARGWAIVKYIASSATQKGVGLLLQEKMMAYLEQHVPNCRNVYAGAWLEYDYSWLSHYNWGYEYCDPNEWPRGQLFGYGTGIMSVKKPVPLKQEQPQEPAEENNTLLSNYHYGNTKSINQSMMIGVGGNIVQLPAAQAHTSTNVDHAINNYNVQPAGPSSSSTNTNGKKDTKRRPRHTISHVDAIKYNMLPSGPSSSSNTNSNKRPRQAAAASSKAGAASSSSSSTNHLNKKDNNVVEEVDHNRNQKQNEAIKPPAARPKQARNRFGQFAAASSVSEEEDSKDDFHPPEEESESSSSVRRARNKKKRRQTMAAAGKSRAKR
ncbi:unnamed protein product [Amoebophrya sp. A120]|nr:unnamed protein product [Amoebophrya sp. A120]|eukprot:GSA120T00001762001.1